VERSGKSTNEDGAGVEVVPSSSHFATHLRETVGSLFCYATMSGMFPQPDTHAFQEYRNRLLEDCGNPTDPVEVMMIEQITLAHLNIGRLQFKSATSESPETARVYGGMATHLLAEFRRCCLALQAFRLSSRHACGAVDLRPDVIAPAGAAGSDHADGELFNKETRHHDSGTVPFHVEEPEASGSREAKCAEATRVHA
jgi:hypothetical protein